MRVVQVRMVRRVARRNGPVVVTQRCRAIYRFVHSGDRWQMVSSYRVPVKDRLVKPMVETPESLHHMFMRIIQMLAWIDVVTMPFFIHRIAVPQWEDLSHISHSIIHTFGMGR